MPPTLNTVKCLRDQVTFIREYGNTWVFVTDVCRVLNCEKYELTRHLNGFDCFKTFQTSDDHNAGHWEECIELEGIKRVCQFMNNDIGNQMLKWAFKLDSSSQGYGGVLDRLLQVKNLCEYFDIDPKDERVCSLVNSILDELE